MMKTLYWAKYKSPLSDMFLACSNENNVSILKYLNNRDSQYYLDSYSKSYNFRETNIESSIFKLVRDELDSYFYNDLKEFTINTDFSGTDFQKKVWSALKQVSYGKAKSYSDIAKSIDNPKAVRAVGMANNRNPIAIIVPCHRVIGKDGSLTGYAGGLDVKKKLLDHETGLSFSFN